MNRLLEEIKNLLTPSTNSKTITIASGTDTSDEIDAQTQSLVSILLPDTFTGATLTLEGKISRDDSFQTITDTEGASYSIAVGNGNAVPIDPVLTTGFNFIRIVSGGNEAAERSITVGLKKI